MLWEHNSTIVVMLTKLREMGRVSSHTHIHDSGVYCEVINCQSAIAFFFVLFKYDYLGLISFYFYFYFSITFNRSS